MAVAIDTTPATVQLTTLAVDGGRPDFQHVLVIDEFDHWHNQPDSLLSPTSITWNDALPVAGRAA
ncbi:hypothetical protein [Actinophytocola sediminis]